MTNQPVVPLTNTPVTADTATPLAPTPSRTRRTLSIAALISGTAFLIDTVTITVINRSFGALDDGLFLTGLLAMAVTLVVLATELSRRARGPARIALAVVVFAVSFAALAALAGVMDSLGRAVFSSSNVGLHGEWSFFSVGLVMLATALWAYRSAPPVRLGTDRRRLGL